MALWLKMAYWYSSMQLEPDSSLFMLYSTCWSPDSRYWSVAFWWLKGSYRMHTCVKPLLIYILLDADDIWQNRYAWVQHLYVVVTVVLQRESNAWCSQQLDTHIVDSQCCITEKKTIKMAKLRVVGRSYDWNIPVFGNQTPFNIMQPVIMQSWLMVNSSKNQLHLLGDCVHFSCWPCTKVT